MVKVYVLDTNVLLQAPDVFCRRNVSALLSPWTEPAVCREYKPSAIPYARQLK